uniref:Aminoglycoside phosphotransferase domain-containing protein n=1 Tax=Lactuca sativa TaxID=4236 RepID=A0A9R1X0Z3_LACSA|nr:hypothetical protein LSAT_V11C700349780 [Lactuca sativa]
MFGINDINVLALIKMKFLPLIFGSLHKQSDDTEDEIDEGEGSRGIKVASRNPKMAVYDPEAAKDTEALASLHYSDVDAIGLEYYGRRKNYCKRHVERWENQYIASTGWLRKNIPFEDSFGSTTGFFHGDLRIDNLVFHPVDNFVFHPLEGKSWPLVGRKFYIAFSFFRDASILAGVHNSEDDSMDDIGEIPILLEWNHELQFCWNGITNSNSVGITEVDA